MDSPSFAVSLSIASVTRCAETGAFRFAFASPRVEVEADLTVAFLAEKGLAWCRFVTVDRVLSADRALERAVEAWVAEHEREVFAAALRAA